MTSEISSEIINEFSSINVKEYSGYKKNDILKKVKEYSSYKNVYISNILILKTKYLNKYKYIEFLDEGNKDLNDDFYVQILYYVFDFKKILDKYAQKN